MNPFGRRGSQTQYVPEDPLLNRSRAAELIGRDPARITGYLKAGTMPEPDAYLSTTAQPLWLTSTIRTWWLDRGHQLIDCSDDAPRYHRPLSTPQLEPQLLEERIIDLDDDELRGQTCWHVRVYQGVDGLGPVVLLGAPREEGSYSPHHWDMTLLLLRQALVADVDDPRTVWLHVSADEFGGEYRQPSKYGLPPRADVVDPIRRDLVVTGDDVARLIGRPFDVYPPDLYTRAAIHARISAGQTDSGTPTGVVTDAKEIEPRLRHLHVLLAAAAEPGPDGPAVSFAAGVVAEDVEQLCADIDDDLKFMREVPPSLLLPEVKGETSVHTRLAVVGQPRTLNLHERAAVDQALLVPRVVVARRRPDPERPWIDRITVRDDARLRLLGIRRILQDDSLSAPRRAALTRAEKLLTEWVHGADHTFAEQDQPPLVRETSAESAEMSTYLGTLEEVSEQQVPEHLRWRCRVLCDDEYAAGWERKVLLLDRRHDLLALVGDQPNRSNPDLVRREVLVNLRRNARMACDAGDDPDPRPSEATIDALVADRLRPRRRVRMEWPAHAPRFTLEELRRSHLVAPSSFYAVYRPVFLRDADGTLQPLPLSGKYLPGWGVSSTDQLTPLVVTILRATHPDGLLHWPHEWEWTQGLNQELWPIVPLEPGGLDMPLAPLVDVYEALPPSWVIQPRDAMAEAPRSDT